MTYEGNCHCGSYRFSLAVDKDGLAQGATTCSCVGCQKLGPIWLPVSKSAIEVTRDDGKLSRYRTATAEHEFCSVCGSTVLGTHSDGPLKGQTTVNIRALRGINPFDYYEKESTTAEAAVTSFPTTGACLCGAVLVELLAPLQGMDIKEDNCSICTRNAWIGAYPIKALVRLKGKENVEDYRFGRKFTGHPFCKTCGVHVYMNVYGPPSEMLDRLPAERKAMIMQKLDVAPVNLRVLDGPIDLAQIKVERTDEGQEGYEKDVLGL